MGKLLGFGLILSGILVGGVGVPLSASTPGGGQSVAIEKQAVRVAEAPALKPLPPGHAGPAALLVPPATPVVTAASDAPLVPPKPVPAVRPAAPAAVAAPGLRPLADPRPPVRPAAAPTAPAPRKPIVTDFQTVTTQNDPASITRALQTELIRVGCYDGAVTGAWSPATRRAMKAFTERVNATLPIDKPDFILLSLVKAQAQKVCGSDCPSGQAAGADGRCLPNAILAQANRKVAPKPQPKPVAVARADTAAAPAPVPSASPSPAQPVAVTQPNAATPTELPPAASNFFTSFFGENQRMALAGPKEPEAAVAAAPATPAVAPTEKDKKAKKADKRDRKDPPAKVSYGQTKWAREFFRSNSTF